MQSPNDQKKTSVAIIGFGRFGQLLADLLTPQFVVKAFDPNLTQPEKKEVIFLDQANILKEKTLFIAVPIRFFETTIKTIAPHLLPGSTVIDVCSVKTYPVKIMQTYLDKEIGIIATHPLFGPDSINNANALSIMMHNVSAKKDIYEQWKHFFEQDKKIKIIEMTPDEHDRQAARSQNITHFIGRLLENANITKSDISTKGFQQLLAIKQQTCRDTQELFEDLMRYNPYTSSTLKTLEKAFMEIISKFII